MKMPLANYGSWCNMFEWFKKSEYSNVVKFPAKDAVPATYIEPPKKDPITYYSLGPTDNNRISLKMGYSSITMNKAGAQAMIDLLTLAMNQLTDEDKE